MLSSLSQSPTKVAAATLLLLALTLTLQTANAQFDVEYSCAVNVSEFPVQIEKLAGWWYEVVRAPDVDVPACVRANAPSAVESDGTYALEINYMNNANKKWKNTTETLNFPWTEDASKGRFQLQYGNGIGTVTFTYKLIGTDYDNIAVVCGYSSIAPRVSFFKILTRERQISDSVKQQVDKALASFDFDSSNLHWVEQAAKCSATRVLPYLSIVLVVLFLLFIPRK